jgi:hypothetical protein
MIRRGPITSATSVPNELLNDSVLSLRARGLAAMLLSKSAEWRIDASALARGQREGRQSILTALKELEDAGYLRRHREQGADGKWKSWSTLYESPHQAAECEPTEVQFPDVGSPNPGNPASGEPDSGSPTSFSPVLREKSREITPAAAKTLAERAEKQALRIAAKAILDPYWESLPIKPVTPYIAIVQRIEEALTAGYPAEAISAVLPTLPAFARNCFDWALRKHGQQMAPKSWDAIARVLAERERQPA